MSLSATCDVPPELALLYDFVNTRGPARSGRFDRLKSCGCGFVRFCRLPLRTDEHQCRFAGSE